MSNISSLFTHFIWNYLGPGLRVGFQGVLHVEIFRQRLLDEFGIEALVTPPKVPYHITLLPSKSNKLEEPITKVVEDLCEWPVYGTKYKVQEPMVSWHEINIIKTQSILEANGDCF